MKNRGNVRPTGRRRHPVNDAESTHAGSDARTPAQRRRLMAWTQGLKQVFGIDVATCVLCSGTVRTAARIEESTVIRFRLGHFAKHGVLEEAHY